MKVRVRVDVCGWFKLTASIPNEKLDPCPIDPRKHSHDSIEGLKECYLGKRIAFEGSRRLEWQVLLGTAKLKEAQVPCPQCACFWEEHDPETCQGVGTKDDNLLMAEGNYYL